MLFIFLLKKKENNIPLKIVIINTHSVLNSGDAGIVIAQLRFLRKYFVNSQIVMTSRTPELDRELFSLYDVTILPPIYSVPSSFHPFFHKIKGSLKSIFSISPEIRLFREIKKCDFVISSGGGYFYSNRRLFPGPMYFQNYLHILLTTIARKPLIYFPQSFGPFHNKIASFLTKQILKAGATKIVWCREEISFNYLTGLINDWAVQHEICPDMAFYLNIGNKVKIKPVFPPLSKPLVALTLRDWDFPELKNKKAKTAMREQYLSAMVDVCKDIYEKFNGSLMFVVQTRGPGKFENDRRITIEIIDKLRDLIPPDRIIYPDIADNENPLYVASLLSTTDLVIATRFHSAIFSLLSGIPVISISYQHKSKGIMRLLDMEQFCLPIADLKREDVLVLIKQTFDQYNTITKKIENNVFKIKKELELKLQEGINSFIKENINNESTFSE